MPRCNRVTPEGTIIATAARGTLMGNRGCLHDDQGQLRRRFQGRRWIICRLQYKGWRMPLAAPGRYTPLFFLDEPTALAAGHRPCALCMRELFELFRAHWASAQPGWSDQPMPSADALDAQLHSERLTAERRQRRHSADLAALPTGCIVLLAGNATPRLVLPDRLLPWQPGGYGPPHPRPASAAVQLLTPPSTVAALAHGYPITLHPTAEQ